MNTGDGSDTFHILSMIEPLSIAPTNNSGGTQAVFLGNASHGTQDIFNNLSITNSQGTTTLNVDDSGNTSSAMNVTISGSSIAGFLGAGSINVSPNALSNLNLLGGTQNNNFTFTGTLAPSTTLNPGDGSNTTRVKQLGSTATLSITALNDAITIGNSGFTAGVLGHVDVTNNGTSALTIDDSADNSARSVSVGSTATTGFNDTQNYTYNTVASLTVKGGSAGNTFTVVGTVPGVQNVLNPGNGQNTIYVVGTSAASSLAINRGTSADTIDIGNDASGLLGLTSGILGNSIAISQVSGIKASVVIDDSNDNSGRTVDLASSVVSGLLGNPAGTVSYNPGEVISLLVKGGNGGNSFTVNNNGSGISPTSITSGSSNDSFIFNDGATLAGGTIDGGGGMDTLDYSNYTTGVVVDLSASPQIATGIGGTSNIENVIAGSGTNIFTAPIGVASTLTGGPSADTFIIPAGAGDVMVAGNGGSDELQISGASIGDTFNQVVVGGTTQTTIADATTHAVISSGINTIVLNGGAGDSTATIDFSGGNPIPAGGETLNGGGGNNNTLNLINDLPGGAPSFNQETYNATGTGTGSINLDGSQIQFNGLSPVVDTVSATNYVFNAPSSLNNIALTPTTAHSFAATLIASTDPVPGFESVAFANKTKVIVNSVTTSDTSVTLNDGIPANGLSTLNVNTGSGEDFINLLQTPSGVPVTVNSGDGTDTFNVNAAGLGSTTTLLGSTATNILTYDAGNATTAQGVSSLQSGLDPNLIYANMTTINVIHIADLSLKNTPATIAVQEGTLFNGIVGSFAASNPAPVPNQLNPVEVAGDFTASIDWGDGTSSAGIVVANGNGGFDVFGSHVYASNSAQSITVQVTHLASSSTSTLNGITTTLQSNGGAVTSIPSTATVTDAPLAVTPAPILAKEGVPVPAGTLLTTFVDANPLSDINDFSATINWGDGTGTHPLPAGSITALGVAGTYQIVSGVAHTYAEEGAYTVTVVISDAGGSQAIATSTATVADAALDATGTSVFAVDGNSFTGQVATFTDGNPAAAISDFTVMINWGNGVITPGVVTQPGGVGTAFVVTGTQTYKAGSYPITVSIADAGGATATPTSTATVAVASLNPIGSGPALNVIEGHSFSAELGAFTSGNPIANALQFAASVDWGDGTTTTGLVTQSSSGNFTVSGTHTYADENTPRTITVTVTDLNLVAPTIRIIGSAMIADAPLVSSGVNVLGVEGTAIPAGTLVASFADANPAGVVNDYTATIYWGDGSSCAGTITAAGGLVSGFLVTSSIPHIYAMNGTYSITVAISDVGGSSTTASSQASIRDAALIATGTNVSAVEGTPFSSQVGTFTDANPTAPISDFTVAVNWGDGIITPGTVTQPGGVGTAFVVTSAHTYKFGSYPITISIKDSGGSTATATSTATVTGAALTPGMAAVLAGTEGQPLSTVLGSFTSTNPLATVNDYTASVTWGDGTTLSTATVSQAPNGTFYVSASHAYAEESSGTPNAVVVTVMSSAGIVATLNATATIADAPLSATAQSIVAVEGIASSLTAATFVDGDPNGVPGDYTVLINWGDGTTSTGAAVTVASAGGSTIFGSSFTVTASHTYALQGTYLVKTTITDAGGSTATATSITTVMDAPLISTSVPVTGTEDQPLVNVPVATFTDNSGPAPITNYDPSIDWGDGKPATTGTIVLGNDGVTFTVFGSHTYNGSGSYPISVLIADIGGSHAHVVTSATIAGAPFAVSGGLDPSSDSGISNHDNITNVVQPTFIGTSGPGRIIKVFASAAGPAFLIGTGVTDAAGHWSIKSDIALQDNVYVISATATNPASPSETTGPTVLLGNGGTGGPHLVIDTQGPVVTETIFRRPLGSIMVAFQDLAPGGLVLPNAGMNYASVADGINYSFSTYGKVTFPPSLITSITVLQQGSVNDPLEVLVKINRGKPLGTGRYELSLKSHGITDIAGNPLDGDFYGYLPSGNHQTGGDFHAILVSNHNYMFAPLPTQSSVTPNNPPGKKPSGFPTPGNDKSHKAQVKVVKPAMLNVAHATSIARRTPNLAHNVHDAALVLVTVKKKGK